MSEVKAAIRELIAYDEARQSAPGEHAATAIAGSILALMAARAPNRTGGTILALAAGALLYRAASGRDGLRKLVALPTPRNYEVPYDVHP